MNVLNPTSGGLVYVWPAHRVERRRRIRIMNFANQIREEQNTSAPVLMNFDDQIGHTFEVQAPLKVPDGTQRPDYIFYRDETARTAHKNKIVTAEDIQHSAFAVGDAKYWERPLDQALNWSIPIITCHLHLKPAS